ncbi:MAG: DUF6152 family protein [Amphiplicatus sp.]
MLKRSFITMLALIVAALSAGSASAHHGWSWTTGESIELIGVIEKARLGNPHGVLDVDVDGVLWTVEVGQPWRNERAGLKDGDLAEGVKVRFVGEPSKNPEEKRLKVVTLYIGDAEHILYPERV